MAFDQLKRVVNREHQYAPCIAWFDDSEEYRYALAFTFAENRASRGWLTAVLLNPSTADAFKLDRTASLMCKMAIMRGYRGLTIVNVFAYRSTDPMNMLAQVDPMGPLNLEVIARSMFVSDWMGRSVDYVDVFAGWGKFGSWKGRDLPVRKLLKRSKNLVQVIKLNSDGSPKHPLYSSPKTEWLDWEVPV